MKRARSDVRDRCEDAALVVVMRIVQWLPAPVVLGGMRCVAALARFLIGGRRRHARKLVLQRLGPGLDGRRADAIVAGAFRTLAWNAVEPLLVERALRRGVPLDAMVTVEGAGHVRSALADGRGVMIATAHIGAWELGALMFGRLFQPMWVVARQLDNPRMERRLLAHRAAFTRGSISKDGGATQLVRVLRQGEAVGMLLDQNAGRGGQIMDFLGAPASHHKVVGVLSRRFGAAVVPSYLLREPGRLRFRLVFEAPLRADPSLPTEEAERDIVARLSASLAARVRAHPEQYLWLHDRWRHAERVVRLAQRAAEDGSRVPVAEGTNGG